VKVLFVILLCTSLIGCAATHYAHVGPGPADQETHDRTLASSKVTATEARGGNYKLSADIDAEQTIENCMRSKGWVAAQ
jgi:hypothetical protein